MRWLIIGVLLVGCGDNTKPQHPRDDAGIDAPPATPDAADTHITGCLDKPGLPTAPNGQLPCDLVPPGLRL